MADDDDYTQIFGVGSELDGPPLLLGFAAVALYLITFSALLDKLEALTFGTSYHLVLQRIYREIMMVGFGSFAFTILNQTNTSLPYGLNTAFGFADICCFAMSSFFCLQGVFIMLLSVKQAQNWNVASQIPAEELLHNMSVWELSHPLAWRSRFLPFCPTREQVEFRVLKSIFATAYNIKASHSEFDFAIFLRMSHENNIVKLIDITFKNWVYILFLIGMQATTDYFHKTSCSSETCGIEEDIKIFTGSGIAVCILSIVAWLWGRYLELRLIASAGVEYVDDYCIFLMTEFRTEENLSDVATSATSAKDIIAGYLKQKEINEVETKEEKYLRRQSIFKRGTKDGDKLASFRNNIARISDKQKKASAYAAPSSNDDEDEDDDEGKDYGATNIRLGTGFRGLGIKSREGSNIDGLVPCVDMDCLDEGSDEDSVSAPRMFSDDSAVGGFQVEVEKTISPDENYDTSRTSTASTRRSSADKCFLTTRKSAAVGCFDIEMDKNNAEMKKQSDYPNQPVMPDSLAPAWGNGTQPLSFLSTASNMSEESQVGNGGTSEHNCPLDANNELENRGMSMIVKRNKKKLFRLSSGEMMKKTVKGVSKAKRKLSRQASDGWRASVEAMFVKKPDKNSQLSAKERETRFADIVKANFGKQNFKELFLFKRPSLFYGLISFVITCNSLYLAWWATNYMFVILSMDGYMLRLWYILITLLPPIITFPTIFLAIRSSTIMQAITFLDLSVVAKVIEQSQINTTMLADFRKTILNFMKKDGPGLDGMIKCCNRFADGQDSVLKKSDFREMLLANKVIYTPEKINFLFGSIDLNGGSTVDYGELETFLFADDNYESDQKRQELFHKMSIHKVQGMRKKTKLKGDNPAQRILNGLKFETFKEKHFLAHH